MTRDAAFFYNVLKPGRYLGGEFEQPVASESDQARDIVWFYPDRYERAITDPAWRRSFFQLSAIPGIRVSRVVDYARDVWQSLATAGKPVFTLDQLDDLGRAASVVFWAPDVLTAARIPSLMKRCKLDESRQSIGVMCNGSWLPRFLLGHVDWIAPVPEGWLPRDLIELLRDDRRIPDTILSARDRSTLSQQIAHWHRAVLQPTSPSGTPRWIPRVEVEEEFADVELNYVDTSGTFRQRELAAVVLDALEGLRNTGIDGIRFCTGSETAPDALAEVLVELQRRYSMKRVRAALPPITTDQFNRNWPAYKPHLLKPTLGFAMSGASQPQDIIDAGARALNAGWQGLSAVLEFDSFDSLMRLTSPVRDIISGWNYAAQGYPDKRPLRLKYRPASVDRWRDRPDQPDDDLARHVSVEFRHFKEDLSRMAAVGTFRIEEVMARNWLAATDIDLWDSLSQLDLSDTNDPEAPPFDWHSWVRNSSGMIEPPKSGFLVLDCPRMEAVSASRLAAGDSSANALMQEPAGNLFGRRKQRGATSRRLAGPSLTRMRVQWAKDEMWRLYSHLDLVRAIERAIRKAGLPASYSEGFHPRLKLAFGPPLAFGLLSDAEYFDLLLDEDCQSADADKLRRNFPQGLRMVDSRGMAAGMPALSDVINEAVYTAILPFSLTDAQRMLDEFSARSDVSWQRFGREDRKPVDPRKTLREVSVEQDREGTRWNLTVMVGGEGNIRPTEWAMLLFGFKTEQLADIVIRRTALHIRRGASVRTPLDPI